MKFKTLDEVKTAVAAGKHVCWRNVGYQVMMDGVGRTLIKCEWNGNLIRLTDKAGDLGELSDFFIRHMCERCEENSVPEPGEICWECVVDVAEQIERAERKQEADWWAEQEDQHTPNFNGY